MGKVLAIDERFRFRPEHVRIKLACRDVSRVPAVAEGTLGLKIYDFFFEREVVDNPSLVPLRSGETIGDPSNQASNKKPRMEETSKGNDPSHMGSGPSTVFGKGYAGSHSAPSKMHALNLTVDKVMEKGKNIIAESEDGKVYAQGDTPVDECEESSDHSFDLWGEEERTDLKHGYGDVRPMHCEDNTILENHKLILKAKKLEAAQKAAERFTELLEDGGVQTFDSDMAKAIESELSKSSEITSQELMVSGPSKMLPSKEDRRRCSRLQKDFLLTTKDKTAITSKKRNLEGTNLNSDNSFAILADSIIMDTSTLMGVHIDQSDFSSIDLIKDLEIARHALSNKGASQTSAPVEETSFEELIEEVSEIDEHVVITPKRKSKPVVRLSLSGH